MLTERMQVLVTSEQRARLERLAARRHQSVGALIREAIDSYTSPRHVPRAEAAARLFALDAPVDDWESMKADIIRGATG